jgi:hypothetical protein
LAVDRVRGELVEEREDLVDDAPPVALNVLKADDFAALSEREALAEPAFELLVKTPHPSMPLAHIQVGVREHAADSGRQPEVAVADHAGRRAPEPAQERLPIGS